MKTIVAAILTVLLAFALGLYFPWWTLALAAFIVYALIPVKPGLAFLSAFVAMFLFWGGIVWVISSNNQHILAHRISQVILKKDDPVLLATATGLIGTVVGGFSALSGRLFRMLIKA